MSTLLEQASLVMIPSGYKEDIVYSQIPTNGNGDLSFTRASNGTRINSAGLVEVVAWNLAQYSEDFSNGVWSISGVTVAANTTTAPNGTNTADTATIGTAGGHFLLQAISVIPLQQYTFSFYVKRGTATALSYSVWNNTAGGNIVAPTNYYSQTSSEWTRISIDFTVPSGCNVIAIYPLRDGASTGTVYLWGAQLNIGSTAKPYFPTTDRLNVPRLTYQNGGGGCPSLLLEKQSTNLALYSQDISNTSGGYWGDGSSGGTATVTANYATSPDGTQNATRIQLNEGSLYAVWQQVIATTSGTTYTYSIWLKAVSGTPTIVWIYDGTANRNITLTNEWVRYTWTFTGGTIQISRFGVWSGVWGTSSTADILAWGAQLEASSYPTSYIPTTSSSATRVADACYKTGISSLIGQTEGTIFVDLVYNGSEAQTGNILSFDQSTSGSVVIIRNANGSIGTAVWDGSAKAVFNGGSMPIGQRTKIAYAYKSGSTALFVNGVQIGSDSGSTFTLPTISQIYLNSVTAYFAFQQSASFNETVIFKTRLTNSELASLTTI